MGFDVFGPTRHVRASNLDDGESTPYDLFTMPAQFGLRCPHLEMLGSRFYETTVLHNADGAVQALRDELGQLAEAYSVHREPQLITERGVRSRDPGVRRAILDRLLQDDVVYRVITEFKLLCEEAIRGNREVRCEGD